MCFRTVNCLHGVATRAVSQLGAIAKLPQSTTKASLNPKSNPNHISNLNRNPDPKANPILNPYNSKPRSLFQTSWW